MRRTMFPRREFFEAVGLASLGAAFTGATLAADLRENRRAWQPISDRKVRVGIVGYGVCRFGAAFGFQDHPNVEIVAVSDLFADRRAGLMEACRCDKSYESLEELVKDPKIEAVFVATDARSHARHCIRVLDHGKHVMCAVPAVWGSVEDAARLVDAVRRTGLKYMMAETSCYHAACHAMRTIYRAGGFGRLVFSEGEYYHYVTSPIVGHAILGRNRGPSPGHLKASAAAWRARRRTRRVARPANERVYHGHYRESGAAR